MNHINHGLVTDFLEKSARETPGKIALVCGGQRLSYAELDAAANRLANGLINKGIERGDRVGLHLPNCVELVISIFAVLKANATFLVINSTTKDDKLSYILRDSGAKACITRPNRADALRSIILDLPDLIFGIITPGDWQVDGAAELIDYSDFMRTYPQNKPSCEIIDLDLACLIYTSGSTGEPKGVMSDHCNVTFAVCSITTYIENEPDDIIINVLPLSFDYGLYQLFMAFSFGGTLILEQGFTYPTHILKRIEEEKVTGLPGVPTIFSVLLTKDLSEYDFGQLRYITNTAAALPPSHIVQLRSLFPDVRLYSMYGLTETKRTLYLPVDQLDTRPGSVGKAIPGTEVWLEDASGKRVPPGGEGELVVRGSHVMRGYWGDEAASNARFRPGPLPGEKVCYTGDLFSMDEDGFLYFVSRMDDIIKCRGEKVSPKEVEGILYQLPGVVEAAVVGIPDEVLGERIKAVLVVADGNLCEMDVRRHCQRFLEDYMIPSDIEFRDTLPKTSSGKIMKIGLG